MADEKKYKSYKPPLTDCEVALLQAIRKHFENPEARKGPSIEELSANTGYGWGTVNKYLSLLEVRGFIERKPGKWRSVRLVDST